MNADRDTPTRRSAVLREVGAAGEAVTAATVAASLGVHPNTVRFHLTALEADGAVRRVPLPGHGAGRPPIGYVPTRRLDPTGPRHYRLLAELLVAAVDAGEDGRARAEAAGAAWGAATGPRPGRDAMIAALDELGFAPRAATSTRIDLLACPFLELAEARPEVVCAVHRGLLRGMTAEGPAPELHPFAAPGRCVVRLPRAGAAGQPSPGQ